MLNQIKGKYRGVTDHTNKTFTSSKTPIRCHCCKKILEKGQTIYCCPNWYIVCQDCELKTNKKTCPHVFAEKDPIHAHIRCTLIYKKGKRQAEAPVFSVMSGLPIGSV